MKKNTRKEPISLGTWDLNTAVSGQWPPASPAKVTWKVFCALFPKMMFTKAKLREAKGAWEQFCSSGSGCQGAGCVGLLLPAPWGDTSPELWCVLGSFTPLLPWATRVAYRTVWWKQSSCFQSARLGVGRLELTSCALFEPITEELAQMGSRQI